jgi:hypothetical protein
MPTFTFDAEETAILLDALQDAHDNYEDDLGDIPAGDAFHADKVAIIAQMAALIVRLETAMGEL